jgi:cysteine desulfurase
VRLIPGGGQESGRRGGTEAAALIAGFGAAAAHFPRRLDAAGTPALIERAERGLRELAPEVVLFGAETERIGNVSNFAVPGLKSAVAMMALDLKGISLSSGSACSSGKVGASHVLKAMGVPAELADCALRLSVGWDSRPADIDAFLGGLNEVLARHRQRRGRAA